MTLTRRGLRAAAVTAASAVALSGCGFSPYDLPLPGGADLGDDPYTVTVQFRDVLDLVPQSAVRINDIAVGKVTDIELNGWTATATLELNRDAKLPDDAEATIRQTSLLGEKFVNLAPPETGGTGQLGDGDKIPLERSGRNPEIEEVLGATSLLLNGGGIEKTNTIVKELGNALDGNEAEVKQLLQTSEAFLGQLDENKGALIRTLEQVDRLARTTNDQRDAITGALDELPEALSVINAQRDDLVTLLESLDRLGDVATGVIRRSKEDTLAVLRDLEPTLRELANAGDELPKAFEVLLSFPFTDAIVGNSVARANYVCSDSRSVEENVSEGACYGDYSNLDINLTLNPTQLTSLIQGILSLPGALAGAGAPALPAAAPDLPTDPAAGGDQLVELVEGLVPTTAAPSTGTPAPRSTPTPKSSSGASQPSQEGGFCSLLGMCRTTTTTPAELMADQDDLGRLVLGPAVAR